MRLIDADALIDEIRSFRCSDCERRKGIKNGKMKFVYDIGDVPCRACDIGDMIDTLDEAPTIGGWISVKDRLPEQHDTIFAKLKGTDKWKKGLFEKQSDDVRVVIECPDGYRRVHHSYLVDGVWACETLPPEGRKVLYWCENPKLPKEDV